MKKYILGIALSALIGSVSVHAQSFEFENVTVTPISSGPSVIPRNGVRIPFLSFRVTAEKDIIINEIQVQQTGLSSSRDIDTIYAESRFARSNRGSVDADGVGRIRFRNDYRIVAGQSHVITILANLSGSVTGTIGFDLIGIESEETAPLTVASRSTASTQFSQAKNSRQGLVPRQRRSTGYTNRRALDVNERRASRSTEERTSRRFRDGERRSSFNFTWSRRANKAQRTVDYVQ